MHPVVHGPSATVWVSSLYGVDYVRLRQLDPATGQRGNVATTPTVMTPCLKCKCQWVFHYGPDGRFLNFPSEGAR